MRQRIVKDRGGPIRFCPPESVLLGPASAATVTIKLARGGDLLTPVLGVPATVDPTSLSLAGDLDVGDQAIPVSGDTSTVNPGSRYLLRSGDGTSIVVRVVGADASRVYLLAGVPIEIASGTLVGIELAYTVTAGNAILPPHGRDGGSGYWGSVLSWQASTPGKSGVDWGLNRAEWTYAIGARNFTRDCLYSVVARLLSPPLGHATLYPYLPQDAGRLARPSEAPGFVGLIDAAWEEVLDDLDSRGVKPDRVMDPDRLRIPHLSRTLARMSSGWGARWKEWSDAQLATYSQKLETADSSPGWIDLDDDAIQDEGEDWSRSVMLAR
jgi:hypothetical protein